MNNVAVAPRDAVKAAMQKSSKQGTMAGLNTTDVSTVLKGMKDQIVAALPKHLTADRMIQMSATLISRNPAIGDCDVKSLIGAVMQASILGFQPVAALGECYFVPYGGKVEFQIGYKGYLKLIQNSGSVKQVYAEVVREKDVFEYELGLERKLYHKPNLEAGEQMISYVYAVAHLKDDSKQFVVLSQRDIEKLRMRSPSQKGAPTGAWKSDYEAMARAKAVKQLAKWLPLSVEAQSSLASDEMTIKPEHFGVGDESGKLDLDAAEQASNDDIFLPENAVQAEATVTSNTASTEPPAPPPPEELPADQMFPDPQKQAAPRKNGGK